MHRLLEILKPFYFISESSPSNTLYYCSLSYLLREPLTKKPFNRFVNLEYTNVHCKFDLSITIIPTAVDVLDYTLRLIATHHDGKPFWKGSYMINCKPNIPFCNLATGGRYLQIRTEEKYRMWSQIVALRACLDMYLVFRSPLRYSLSTKGVFLV